MRRNRTIAATLTLTVALTLAAPASLTAAERDTRLREGSKTPIASILKNIWNRVIRTFDEKPSVPLIPTTN